MHVFANPVTIKVYNNSERFDQNQFASDST